MPFAFSKLHLSSGATHHNIMDGHWAKWFDWKCSGCSVGDGDHCANAWDPRLQSQWYSSQLWKGSVFVFLESVWSQWKWKCLISVKVKVKVFDLRPIPRFWGTTRSWRSRRECGRWVSIFHLYLNSFLVEARLMYIFILYEVIFSLKVRGARLMREMEKPEDEEEVEEDDEDPEEEEGTD